jgi:hypothetical protein
MGKNFVVVVVVVVFYKSLDFQIAKKGLLIGIYMAD